MAWSSQKQDMFSTLELAIEADGVSSVEDAFPVFFSDAFVEDYKVCSFLSLGGQTNY